MKDYKTNNKLIKSKKKRKLKIKLKMIIKIKKMKNRLIKLI